MVWLAYEAGKLEVLGSNPRVGMMHLIHIYHYMIVTLNSYSYHELKLVKKIVGPILGLQIFSSRVGPIILYVMYRPTNASQLLWVTVHDTFIEIC